MKTTLSTIILEESINAYLHEIDINTGTDYTKQEKQQQQKVNNKLVNQIATDIIDSYSWINDDETLLISSIKKINNLATYNQVDKLIRQKEKNTNLPNYLSKMLSKDDWDYWYPIIKHLSKVIPKEQWKTTIKPILKYTNGLAGLASIDMTLSDKISQVISVTDNKTETDWKNPATYTTSQQFIGLAIIVAGLSCWIGGGLKGGECIKNLFKRLSISKKDIAQKDPVTIASWWQRLARKPTRKNKEALLQIFKRKYEGSKKTNLDLAEYNAAKYYIEYGLTKNQLNKIIFENILWFWKMGNVQAGDALKIKNIVNDHNFNIYMYPKLKAIEEELLAANSEKFNLSTKLKNRIITGRSVKFKLPAKNFNMERWLKVMTDADGLNIPTSTYEEDFIREVGKRFKWLIGKNPGSPEISAKQAIDLELQDYLKSNWWGKKTKPSINNFPIAVRWQNWIDEVTTTGAYKHSYYDQFDSFPSFEQWKSDMRGIGTDVKLINQNQYDAQKFAWANSRVS